MSDNARDTQFAGFAKALWQEIIFSRAENVQNSIEDNIQLIETIIARRAYDLAVHVVAYLDEDVMQRISKGYILSEIVNNDVPDMTELPKESS